VSDPKKNFLPFSNPGSVAYLKPIEEDFLLSNKLPEHYLQQLKNKRLAKVFLFSMGEKSLKLYPIFRELGFEPFTIEPPTFPSKLNYDKNDSYLLYAKSLSNFLLQMNRKDIFIFYPESQYTNLVLFLVSAYLLSDENIQEDELIQYFYEDRSDIKTIHKDLTDMKNFLYGEFYLTYLSIKQLPEVHLQIEKTLQIENDSPVYKKLDNPPIKVELISTENNIPYELNLSSLSQKFSPDIEKSDELSFNLSSLTPKEFSPESEEAEELLDNLMEMADSFESKVVDKDIVNLDEIEDDENEEPTPFLTLKQIPKPSPAIAKKESQITQDYLDLNDIVNIDLPEPEVLMETFLFEKNSMTLNLEDPIFQENFIPSVTRSASNSKDKNPVKKNFLCLPENW